MTLQKRLLGMGGVLAALAVVAAANTVPGDPQILIDDSSASTAITNASLQNVQPCGSATCTYDFENDTGSIINSFTFVANLSSFTNPNLSLFSCPTEGGGPFFLNCLVTPDSVHETVTFQFFGINPENTSTADNEPTDAEINEQEGIPVNDGLTDTNPGFACGGVEQPACPEVGHFVITLSGWDTFGTAQILSNNFTTVPEPGAFPLFGLMVLIGGVFGRRYARNLI